MKLDSIYFNYIKSGKKEYETRIYDEKRQKIKLLEEVIFTEKENEKNTFTAIITELSYFKNFKEAIEEVGVKKVLPNAKSLKEAIKIYESFPTYKEGAKKYGVLRMKFVLVKHKKYSN